MTDEPEQAGAAKPAPETDSCDARGSTIETNATEPSATASGAAESGATEAGATATGAAEIGGPNGPEPTRYGDWERAGRCIDF